MVRTNCIGKLTTNGWAILVLRAMCTKIEIDVIINARCLHACILHLYRSVPKYDVTEEELMNDIESHYYWYKRKRKWHIKSGRWHYVTGSLWWGGTKYQITEMLIIMYLSETTKRLLNICMNHQVNLRRYIYFIFLISCCLLMTGLCFLLDKKYI